MNNFIQLLVDVINELVTKPKMIKVPVRNNKPWENQANRRR
jgi:hypothetical protein